MRDERVDTLDTQVEMVMSDAVREKFRSFLDKCGEIVNYGRRCKVCYGALLGIRDMAIATMNGMEKMDPFFDLIEKANCLATERREGIYFQFTTLDALKKAVKVAKKCGLRLQTDYMRDFMYIDELEACGILRKAAQA